jgi:hypothetical protein
MRRPCSGLCWSVPISADSACNIGRHSVQRHHGVDGCSNRREQWTRQRYESLHSRPQLENRALQHRMRSLHATNISCVIRFTQSSETFHNPQTFLQRHVSQKRPNFIQCFIPSRNIRLLTGDCRKMASHKLCVDICIVTCVSVLEALGAQLTNSKSFGCVSPFSVVIRNPDECRLAAGLAPKIRDAILRRQCLREGVRFESIGAAPQK